MGITLIRRVTGMGMSWWWVIVTALTAAGTVGWYEYQYRKNAKKDDMMNND